MTAHRLEVRLSTLRQLFNSLDPSPFHEKDLDQEAEDYIVGWANEYPPQSDFELIIRLPAQQVEAAERSDVGRAIHNYFAYRAKEAQRRLRFLLREGRWALAIGLVFLFACMALRQLLTIMTGGVADRILQEGLLILGWVAMWRPLQIILYDWWPIRRYARLYSNLATMPVKLVASTEPEWEASSPPVTKTRYAASR
jgi:hypothetical protein